MPEYRILHLKPVDTDKLLSSHLSTSALNRETTDDHQSQELNQNDQTKPGEPGHKSNLVERHAADRTLSMPSTTQNRSLHDDKDVNRSIEIQPWDAVRQALIGSIDLRAQEFKTEDHDPEFNEDSRVAQSNQSRLIDSKLVGDSIDDVMLSQTHDENAQKNSEKLIHKIGPRHDKNLAQSIESNLEVQPWQAIEDREVVHSKTETISRLDAFLSSRTEHPNPVVSREDFLLTNYDSTVPEKPTIDQDSNESFTCVLPLPIAHEAAIIGPLEPEAVQYLCDEYKYIERHVDTKKLESEFANFPGTSNQLASHTDITLTERKVISPKQSKRAGLQIEFLQSIKQAILNLPHSHHCAALALRADLKTASYDVLDLKNVEWQPSKHLPAHQKIIDERDSRYDEHKQNQENRARSERKTQFRQTNRDMRISRDIKVREKELEQLVDCEPQPRNFCSVIYTPENAIIVKVYSARTLEEFEQKHLFEPTPSAVQSIVEIDREYKLWLSRKRTARSHLEQARSEDIDHEIILDHDYDHDDLER